MNIGFQRTNETPAVPITSLSDSRLVLINPQEEGFFDKVLGFVTEDEEIFYFIQAVKEVKEEKIASFYKPIYDPSETVSLDEGETQIIFRERAVPAVNHSISWWEHMLEKMPEVEGRRWTLATEFQYYAFLVYLINKKVDAGRSVAYALNEVVKDSKSIGNFRPMELEYTGSRWVFGFYDLGNTYKLLKCSPKNSPTHSYNDYWLAGDCVLASLHLFSNPQLDNGVGLIVL